MCCRKCVAHLLSVLLPEYLLLSFLSSSLAFFPASALPVVPCHLLCVLSLLLSVFSCLLFSVFSLSSALACLCSLIFLFSLSLSMYCLLYTFLSFCPPGTALRAVSSPRVCLLLVCATLAQFPTQCIHSVYTVYIRGYTEELPYYKRIGHGKVAALTLFVMKNICKLNCYVVVFYFFSSLESEFSSRKRRRTPSQFNYSNTR